MSDKSAPTREQVMSMGGRDLDSSLDHWLFGHAQYSSGRDYYREERRETMAGALWEHRSRVPRYSTSRDVAHGVLREVERRGLRRAFLRQLYGLIIEWDLDTPDGDMALLLAPPDVLCRAALLATVGAL